MTDSADKTAAAAAPQKAQPARLLIPPVALAAQAQSSDAAASVWVSANAGSGKTHVLTERVIRLLLGGTRPARILCLTYTKAAAAVMQTRIFERLARWTALSEPELKAELAALEGRAPDALKMLAARRLFAEALETPGGLKIQTIHAFCESLLHQFPLEANIPGHFDMMDDAGQQALMAEAKKQILTEIYTNPQSPLAAAFQLMLALAGEASLDKLLAEAISRKQELELYAGELAAENSARLNSLLGLKELALAAKAGSAAMAEELAAELKKQAMFSPAEMQTINAEGGAKAKEFVQYLLLAEREQQPAAIISAFGKAYCTFKGEPKKPGLFGKKLLSAYPQLEDLFIAKAQAVVSAADLLKAVELRELNQAAYRLIKALTDRYAALKRARGLMDFADLISCALRLLQRKDAGPWVQYKLDKGIDHILVDEAQDTGPEQWEIIRILSREFFAGLSAREDLSRTIFAVGDEKQSIYSFQGASPQDFAENGRYQQRQAQAAQKTFRRVSLAFSFRSAPEILAAVDQVFSIPENYRGLSDANEPTAHTAIRAKARGLVEIWPPFIGEAEPEPEEWTEPQDKNAAPPTLLAEAISRTIAGWLSGKERQSLRGRPIKAGDIMILVRKRDEFVHALARSLKKAEIAVAGADRLRLTDHIAIRDLMAAGDFVLQPRDDLALAALLKSPLFGISEEQLLDLAAERPSTLWEALNKSEELRPMAATLRRWRSFADIDPVYEFYSRILAEDGGRKRFLARLGAEAGDILDAFLDYCLEAQQADLPGLQVFLQNLRDLSPEIKREQDQNRDEVRIMTVHAAKGQEAPIVFLADGGGMVWHSSHAPCLLPMGRGREGSAPPRLWLPKAEYKTKTMEQSLEQLKQAAEEEYHRLLYVAMTRAEDRLIVCGYCKSKENESSWLPIIRRALADKAAPAVNKAAGLDVLRFAAAEPAAAAAGAEAQQAAESAKAPKLPALFSRPAPAEPALPRPLAPSGAAAFIAAEPEDNPERLTLSPILPIAGGGAAAAADTPQMLTAMARGTLIHSLLQYLPAFPPAERRRLAQAFLAARLPAGSGEAKALLKAVFKVLEDKNCAELFNADGRSEVPLMGVVKVKGHERAVSGQIDRLVFAEKRLIFADYKTGQPPQSAADIPPVYKMQMALYAALLAQIYPQKPIEARLIYTRNGGIFSFTAAELQTALA